MIDGTGAIRANASHRRWLLSSLNISQHQLGPSSSRQNNDGVPGCCAEIAGIRFAPLYAHGNSWLETRRFVPLHNTSSVPSHSRLPRGHCQGILTRLERQTGFRKGNPGCGNIELPQWKKSTFHYKNFTVLWRYFAGHPHSFAFRNTFIICFLDGI